MFSLHIPAMTCGGCASAITRIIQRQDGDARVSADIPQKRIALDTQLTEAQVLQLLSDGGYGAGLEVIHHE